MTEWHHETTSTLTTAASGAALGGSGSKRVWNVWGAVKATAVEADGDREWRIRSVWSGAPIGVCQTRQSGVEESKIAPMATVGLLWVCDGAFVSLFNCGYLGGEVATQRRRVL